MSDTRHRLQYLATGPARPPMYSLVLSVLGAAFLLCFGGLLAYGVTRDTYDRLFHGGDFNPLWLILFVPVAAVFLVAGVRWMADTVGHLRGRQGNDVIDDAGSVESPGH